MSCAEVAKRVGLNRATVFRHVRDITRKREGYGDFWHKVKKTGGCWIWTGRHQRYGRFGGFEGDGTLAHRHSWFLANGPIPNGLHVLHKCDNTLCVRPDHLFLGTHKDNMRDAMHKGRNAYGERAGTAKLTERYVRDIRAVKAKFGTIVALAAKYGVDRQTIYNVRNRETWRHVN